MFTQGHPLKETGLFEKNYEKLNKNQFEKLLLQ